MAWTWYQRCIAVLMVFTGSINTLATKWADREYSIGKDGTFRQFNHPFLQACSMFLGEFSCLIAFKILYWYYKRREAKTLIEIPPTVQGNQDFNPFIFYLPAMCDLLGTSTMYISLTMTYASSFQMLRGSVIIFTGLFSVAFLNRRLKIYEWLGIFVVVLGLVCIGVSDVIYPPKDVKNFDANKVLTGNLLIIMAQIIVATQMIVEEKFIRAVNPLQGVGWEGFFGFVTLSILLVPMYYIKIGKSPIFANPDGQLEDAIDGFVQIGNSWKVALGLSGTVLSIAFFNFAGLTVTKELSATTRMVLDSVRTFFIWAVSLAIGWQQFTYLQLIGFIVLSVGMCLYNDVIIRPMIINYQNKSALKGEVEPLMRSVDEESPSTYFKSSESNSASCSINQ